MTRDLEGIERGDECRCRWGLHLGARDGETCPNLPDGICGYCVDHSRIVVWWAEAVAEERNAEAVLA